jgi:DNA mismatch repair protein MutL
MSAGKPAPIRILPPELQNQIAAGEVVERPASVLKELVENSLDAGATRVEATIESGGQSRILVQDNGTGLSSKDLELALTRHATSKISSVQDLNRISSFGFRGEALPSIASVSRMEICSITPGANEGNRLKIEFGKVMDLEPLPFREGTRVEVQDLFINTPARLKFLKTQATEGRRCQEIMQRMALANLEAGLSLSSNDRTLFDFSPGETLEERLQRIWPRTITDRLISVDHRVARAGLQGVTGHPETAQSRGDRILFFVNNRPVQDKTLLSALRQAYKGMLLSKEAPQAVLFIHIDPDMVDINVHPAKSEVRFRDEQLLFSLVRTGVASALSRVVQVVESSPTSGPAGPSQGHDQAHQPKFQTFADFLSLQEDEAYEAQAGDISPAESARETPAGQGVSPDRRTISPSTGLNAEELVYLGQIQDTYLVLADRSQRLILIDQHAAHERILYHAFARDRETVQSRLLALPLDLELHPAERDQLEKSGPKLRRLGFSYQRPNPETLVLRAVPESLDPSQATELIREILAERTDSWDRMLTLMACRNAVKAGEPLSRDEAMNLLQAWMDCPDKDFCPHGRPAAVSLGSRELGDLFKRGK